MASGSVSLINGHIDEMRDDTESIVEKENVQTIEVEEWEAKENVNG